MSEKANSCDEDELASNSSSQEESQADNTSSIPRADSRLEEYDENSQIESLVDSVEKNIELGEPGHIENDIEKVEDNNSVSESGNEDEQRWDEKGTEEITSPEPEVNTPDSNTSSPSENLENPQNSHENGSFEEISNQHEQDPNNSFLDSDANKENEGEGKINKRRSDEGLEIRDELDFEEEKESGEEGEESEGETGENQKEVINKEEGELSDEDEDDSLLRQEPKTVCRFFNKGQCTWGTNCRFLHPGVSDKGNYNMFAAPKPTSQTEKEDTTTEKERPREVRRFIPEPVGVESAWERGLRHAKEMMKRANKRKETDADFEEKRFNLSLGQAELDRENDYYTRPASPVYKPSDEVVEYLDPYEKQAIRHFRGGHFENFEVRYKVDPAYPNRGPENIRSRRDKFEREVTERIPRRLRPTASPAVEDPKSTKEKRYPRPRVWKEERVTDAPSSTLGKGEAEVWADPWVRRKTPVKRVKKVSRTRSYSSGSSSRSSRSSRSLSYSSYSRSRSRSGSRSRSRSTSKSRSSRSSSRSITPPIHPRQQRAFMNRGARGGRGRGGFPGDRGGGRGMHRNPYQNQPFSQPPNPPPNHPLAPNVSFPRQPMAPMGNRRGMPPDLNDNRSQVDRKPDIRNIPLNPRGRINMPMKQEPRKLQEIRERPTIPIKTDVRIPPVIENRERVDMFGRTIRKDVPRSPSKSHSRSPGRHGRRKFSPSTSGSRSRSGSSSRSSGSRSGSLSRSGSRSRSRSVSGSRSRSSSSASSITPPPSPVNKRKVDRTRRVGPGTVSYGEVSKTKAIDLIKVAGQKQQIKLTLKKPGPVKPVDKTVLDVDDDSGESDTDARILKKRKIDTPPANPPPPVKVAKPRVPSPTALASLTMGVSGAATKKPAARREELLKQLRAVEDAIARKRSKPLT